MQLTKKQQKGKAAKEVIATAQDIKYARFLAGNDKVIRDKAVKSLKKWFEQRCRSQIPFSDSDLMLVWKGLFYSMWMSDKALIQEECAERISSLIHSLDVATGFQFFKAGMKTLANEWFGIDQWRSDKFMMFVRRFLRQAFVLLKNNHFDLKLIKLFALALEDSILSSEKSAPLSLMMHFCDIYMPELAKVSEGQLNANILNEFLHPFVKALSKCSDMRIVNAISDGVFRYLMKQSNAAMEHEEKFEAWKSLGFPGGSIDALQKAGSDGEDDEDNSDLEEDDDEAEEDDDEAEEDDNEDISEQEEELTGMDARAGRVNVVLPQMNFSCKNISSLMNDYKFKAWNTKARSAIKKLMHEFTALAGGDYPLGIRKVDLYEDDGSTNIKKAANKLVKFENQVYGRNKPKTAKKRKINDDGGDASDGSDRDQEVPIMKKAKVEKQQKKQGQDEKKTKKKLKSNKIMEENALNGKKKQVKEKVTKDNKLKRKTSDIFSPDDEQELKELRRKLKVQLKERKKMMESIRQKKHDLQMIEVNEAAQQKRLESDADDLFVRNSGTWFVSEPDSESDYELENSSLKISPKISPKTRVSTLSPKSSPKTAKSPSPSTKFTVSSTPIRTSPTSKKLFDTTEWDADLQDGEVELFVPSKKYLAKRKSVGAPADLVEKSFSILKGKNRRKSLGLSMAAHTPKSNKKVKIDLRLNQSQEVYEHHAQIRSSPAIPFDAAKKPTRPVIKANAMPSPINPFYNKRRIELQF